MSRKKNKLKRKAKEEYYASQPNLYRLGIETKERLRKELPELGFAFEENDEYHRDEYTKDFGEFRIIVYVDKNTTRIEMKVGKVSRRKCYNTCKDIAPCEDFNAIIRDFIETVKQ